MASFGNRAVVENCGRKKKSNICLVLKIRMYFCKTYPLKDHRQNAGKSVLKIQEENDGLGSFPAKTEKCMYRWSGFWWTMGRHQPDSEATQHPTLVGHCVDVSADNCSGVQLPEPFGSLVYACAKRINKSCSKLVEKRHSGHSVKVKSRIKQKKQHTHLHIRPSAGTFP
jgi:hypothetical protein